MAQDDWDCYSVDKIMARWPQTVRVFLDYKLLCPGCPIAEFHSLEDAAEAHDISLKDLKNDIAKVLTNVPEKI